MRLIKKIKKGTAVILSAALMAGLVPFMPHSVSKVQAAAGSKKPSIAAYVTKEQLMDSTFAPNSDGKADNTLKLAFGLNEDGKEQEWYVLGSDSGVNGGKDNTIIFAANPIRTKIVFNSTPGRDDIPYQDGNGTYADENPSMVHQNHYGASDLRKALQEITSYRDSNKFFSKTELSVINTTTVTTDDTNKKEQYTTSDKLYTPYGSCYGADKIEVGSDDGVELLRDIYWGSGNDFWLRSPDKYESVSILYARTKRYVSDIDAINKLEVRPASNLNLTSVLFASSASSAPYNSVVSGIITDGTAMKLRYSGRNKNIGLVLYNSATGEIKAEKSISASVSLVVQGNDGTNDWYYSKNISRRNITEVVNVSDIKKKLNSSQDIDLEKCKIWIETTDDRMIYAVQGEKEIEKINKTYATKEQLMNSFSPYSNGKAANIGRLAFGKNSRGMVPKWYILGKDNGVNGGKDNTVIFADDSVSALNVVFNSNKTDVTYQEDNGTYKDGNPSTVYSNHYGASELRKVMQEMTSDGVYTYFSPAEKNLLFNTRVTINDTKNNKDYTVSDKLYAPQIDSNNVTNIKVGSADDIVLPMNTYWNSGTRFWLRSPVKGSSISVFGSSPRSNVGNVNVFNVGAVRPVSNLNLSNVLFASSVKLIDTYSVVAEILSTSEPMILRFDGKYKNIGTVYYNTEKEDIAVIRASIYGAVSLVVQGNDGTKEWCYSKPIKNATDRVEVADIKSSLNISGDINLEDCKIWIETTETDGLIYAVSARKEIEKINTTYATKDQLMKSFSTYSDGTAINIGKLEFGKNEYGAYKWYILGKDNGIAGDNTVLFVADQLATGINFNSNSDEIAYSDDIGKYDEDGNPSKVYSNHYGASELRQKLQSIADSNFTTTEKSLMQPTTVTVLDTKNNRYYTVSDKLYAASRNLYRDRINVGSSDNIVLSRRTYWSNNNGKTFWLRTAYENYSDHVYVGHPNYIVNNQKVYCDSNNSDNSALRPACNLNLSSVLFASAATASYSGSVETGTINDGTAMKLRLDGSSKDIGTAIYNTYAGKITVKKGNNSGKVVLMVQGNEGKKNWYFCSSPLNDSEYVCTSSYIKEALNLSEDIDLSKCHIWLETKEDDMAYAVNALSGKVIDRIDATVNAPKGEEKFDTDIKCNTEGIADAAITWTDIQGNAVSSTVDYYPAKYKAHLTFSPAEGYVLAPYTKIFINGREFVDEKVVDKNGIISATGGFESDKRKITTIKKPVVPADNTFTQYYTEDSILDSNDELGNTAGLSFDGSMEPVTGEIDVTWTLEGDYNDSPSAENTFRWSFDVSKLEDYEIAVGCETTGIAVIKNKAATPVSITGTDTGLEYDESDIDVSQYFTIDSNAGTAVYSLVSKETDGSVTGEGTLDGSILNIKNTGIFKVKVITAANGNYAAGEAVITLTVENGTILYNATDYSGTYDGKPHSISVDVMSPSSTNVTYSTDGKTYSTNNPVFTDAGEYTVCYKIEKSNYDTVTGEKKVVIAKKDLEVKVDDQRIVWGNDIDNTKYNVSGLTEGDGISEITLKASTTALTDNGTISVSSIAITNDSKDVTSNYDIALSDGKLVIEHNTSLVPTRLDAHKKKTAYEAGEILNVDDITVTAYYEDGYSEQITGYTTNADELDMNTVGEKILAVSYTKNGDTKTCRFKIIVTHTHGFDNAVWHSDSINHWKECTKSYCDKSDGYKIQEISHTCEYTYTWSDDYKTCTAVRKCSICEYTDSETAASDIVVVQNRDCTNPEIIEYVARFKNSLYNDFETQIKGNFEAAPATGHNMSEWTSNRDNTHSRICTNSGCTYKETEKCSGGTATYFKKAICDDCKAEHGDFKADTIKPTGEIKLSDNTWNTLLNKITFGRFFSATQKVTIAGTDDSYSSDGFNLSEDAVKISYLLASGDEAKAYTTDELEKRFTAGEFKNYKASFNVNPDNKYVVFARIEDHAGNATYISSDGVVIDSTTPVIDGVAEGEIYCEKVEFTVSDDNFDKVADIIGDDVQTLTSINGRYILADGMHKVIAYDKAGNSTEVNFVVNANHTVSEWMTDKEATIEETGSRHKECKVCGTILEKADIEKLVPLEYKIIAGADSSWSQNTDMNLVIKGNGNFAKFIRIKVDGVSVDATNYTVAEGSTIITLKPDYIKTLSVGSHVFEIIWKDGIASTSFTIVNNEVADTNNNQGTDITQPGDTAKPVLWSMLFMVSFAGFAVMSGRKKKNCK